MNKFEIFASVVASFYLLKSALVSGLLMSARDKIKDMDCNVQQSNLTRAVLTTHLYSELQIFFICAVWLVIVCLRW